MKIDFATVLRDKQGQALKDQDGKDATLGGAAETALFAAFTDEASIDGAEKAKRFKLGMRVGKPDEEFTPEEVALMKRLIGKAFGPIIVGRAYELLDG
jgi:hypothetical protein